MENESQLLRIDVKIASLNGRGFAQCCFVSQDHVIGDFEQRMLLGSLGLAVGDLVDRIKKIPDFDFRSSRSIEEVFDGMSVSFLKAEFDFFEANNFSVCHELKTDQFFALPLAIEAFDGEEAYVFKFEKQWRFVWRQWETKEVVHFSIDRNLLIQVLGTALEVIRSEAGKNPASDAC
ncbi:hypothetical protein [Variovorax paradoxus]|uniref:hypothetical protein n=1 Tax=Variovorax paradoxus TaxID=34073 RepID=UPI0030D0BB96